MKSFRTAVIAAFIGCFIAMGGVLYLSKDSKAALKAVAGFNQAAVAITGGTITGITDLAVADGGTGASTAVAAGANLGFATKLAQWNVPVGMAPSGSMANNGAVTFGTAFTVTYSNGIWLWYPAGAVAAGVPASASFLWTTCASTTVCTVWNDASFTGASVPTTGTQTAYVTTGPGAFTGVTSVTTAITITVPANTLGSTGAIFGDWLVENNTAAGNKTFHLFYTTTAGTDYGNFVVSTAASGAVRTVIRNNGTGLQTGTTSGNQGNGTGLSSGIRRGTADTTASTTLVYRMTNATATNWMVIEGGSFFTAQ